MNTLILITGATGFLGGATAVDLSAGAGSSQTFRQIGKAMAAAKLANVTSSEYEHIEVSDVECLLTRIRERIPHCNPRLLTRALKLYAEFASLNYVFSNNNVLKEGIPSPPRFTDYLALCVASTRDIPITRQMEWDFK